VNQYHKIENPLVRDLETHRLIHGKWKTPTFCLLQDIYWEGTEKLDGTNTRVMYRCYTDCEDPASEMCWFGGKTDKAEMPKRQTEALDKLFPSEPFRGQKFRDVFGENQIIEVCLYGEAYGPGIQKVGVLYGPEVRIAFYDIMVNGKFLSRANVVDVCNKMGLTAVPVVARGTLGHLIECVRRGIPSHFSNCVDAEGLVARPAEELTDQYGNRVITKIKGRDFQDGK